MPILSPSHPEDLCRTAVGRGMRLQQLIERGNIRVGRSSENYQAIGGIFTLILLGKYYINGNLFCVTKLINL